MFVGLRDVGLDVGNFDGMIVLYAVGFEDGNKVEGMVVGERVGSRDGLAVGWDEDEIDGSKVVAVDGLRDVGLEVGDMDGMILPCGTNVVDRADGNNVGGVAKA